MEHPGGLAGAAHGSRVSAVLSPCLHIVVHVPENMWQRPQTVVALTSPSRPALPPDPELGSRRQSKVKYIYRLLREKDVGESLEGKTVRVKAAPPAAAPLLRPCLRFPLCPCNTGTRQSGARQPFGRSSAVAVVQLSSNGGSGAAVALLERHQKCEVGMRWTVPASAAAATHRQGANWGHARAALRSNRLYRCMYCGRMMAPGTRGMWRSVMQQPRRQGAERRACSAGEQRHCVHACCSAKGAA